MNHSWMSAIIRRLNSVENKQVFWPWSSFRMSACTVPRTLARAYAARGARSSSDGSRPSFSRNASTCWSMAVLRKNASTVRVGVAAVERHRVERRRQAGGVVALGEDLEAAVGARGIALAREHPRRVLVVALEREDAGGEGEVTGQVLVAPEAHELAMVGEAGERDARDLVAAQRLPRQPGGDLAVADHHDLLVAGVGLHDRGPPLDLVGDFVRDGLARLVEEGGHAARVAVGQLVGDVLHALEVAGRLRELGGPGVI